MPKPALIDPDVTGVTGVTSVTEPKRPALVDPVAVRGMSSTEYNRYSDWVLNIEEKKAKDFEEALVNSIAFGQDAETYLRHPVKMKAAMTHNSVYADNARNEARGFYDAVVNLGKPTIFSRAEIPVVPAEEVLERARLFRDQGEISEREYQQVLENPQDMHIFGELAPSYFYDKSLGERGTDMLQGFSGGVNHSLASFSRGIQWLEGELGVNVGARAVADWFDENAGVATRGMRQDVLTDIWGAVGSMSTLVLPAGAVGALGRLAGLSRGLALSLEMGTASVSEALMEAGGSYNNVLQKTGDINQANKAARISFGSNLALLLVSNRLGIYKSRYDSLQQGPRKLAKVAVEGAGVEFGQEAGQAFIGQFAEERPLDVGEALYSGFIGGIVGGGVSVLMARAARDIEAVGPMPPKTAGLYDRTAQKGLDEGLPLESAHIQATQAIAQTPEGEEYIDKVMVAQESVLKAEAAMGQDVPTIAPEAAPGEIAYADFADQIDAGTLTEEEAIAEIERRLLAPKVFDEASQTLLEARRAGDIRPVEDILTPEQQGALTSAQEAFSERLTAQRERMDEQGLTMAPDAVVNEISIQSMADLLNQGDVKALEKHLDNLRPGVDKQEVRHNVQTLANIQNELGLIDLGSEVSLAPILERLRSFSADPAQGFQDVLSVGRAVFAEGKVKFDEFSARIKEIVGEAFESIKPYLNMAWDVLNNERGAIGKEQTETPEFKAWFKDSKVVDKNGEPLVVYHGTGAEKFKAFEQQKDRITGLAKPAFFFSSSTEDASSFAVYPPAGIIGGERIISAYISLSNPYIVDAKNELFERSNLRKWDSKARDIGADGIIINNIKNFPDSAPSTTYIAFSPTQIKSATGNVGTFDPTVSDIGGLIDLNAEISLAPVLERLRSFKDNPAQGLQDLTSIGRSIWAEGKTAFNEFSARMREILGDLWTQFKDIARQAWEIIKDERGSIAIGPGGKPYIGQSGQVLWAKWFNSKGQLRMSDWVKAEIFNKGGAIEDNGSLRFISRTTPKSKGKGTVFGFDQFAQMAHADGLIPNDDVQTLLDAIKNPAYLPPISQEKAAEEGVPEIPVEIPEGKVRVKVSDLPTDKPFLIDGEEHTIKDIVGFDEVIIENGIEIRANFNGFLLIDNTSEILKTQEIKVERPKPVPGQLFGATEFKDTMRGKIPGGSQAVTEIERAAEESRKREAEARDREANVELFETEQATTRATEVTKATSDPATREAIRAALQAVRKATAATRVEVARTEGARVREIFARARERQAVTKNVNATQKRLKKLRKSKKKNIAVDYQKRINNLIDTIDLKGKPTEATLNHLISFKEWLDTHKDKMNVPPERLAQLTRLGKLSLREMTPEDVKEIDQTIKHLVQMGKLKRRLKVKYDKQRLAEVTKEFTDTVNNIDGDYDTADPTKGQIFKRGIKSAYLVTMHVPRVADIQDGFNDYNGVHAKMSKDFLQRETSSNMTSQAIVKKAMDDIIEKAGITELTDEQQDRIMIHIRLQEGAKGAAKTLMEKKGYTQGIPAITEQEQEIINILKEATNMFTDQIAATVEEIDNQIFPIAENYILPLKYEKDTQTGAPPLDSFLHGGYRTTKTEQGFKFERVKGVKKTPRTDILAIFNEAINAQQWYLNMQPAIEEARQVVLSEEYAEAAGELNFEYWKEQLDIISRRGWSATAGGNRALNAAFREGRINLSQAILGYKISSILMQPFAIFDAMAYTTMRWGPQTSIEMTKEFTKAWIKPNYAKSIIEGSPALQLRQAGELAVEEVLERKKGKGFVNKFVRGGFEGLKAFDVRTAAGVREGILHILQTNGVENAEAEADFLMNMVSASADVTMRPQILSKGEGARLWFTFQSFFLNRWGIVAHDLIQGGVVKGDWKRKMTATLGLAILMAGGLAEDEAREIVFETTTGKELPEDETIRQILLYVPSMIPILGPMVEAAFTQRTAEPPLIRTGQQVIKGGARVATGKDLESRAKGALKLTEAAVTLRFGVPGTAQFFDFAERILFEDKKKNKRRR